jgi:pimeloyl-ACP methyl ester carboxylesterase
MTGVQGPSQLAILEHCGHVPHRERSAEVLRLAAAFLDARGPAEPR